MSTTMLPDPLPLGKIVATPGALALLERRNVPPPKLLDRHARGDWGDLELEDHRENFVSATSVTDPGRVVSNYRVGPRDEDRVWIITEADRSATTLLLPREY